MVGFIGPEYLYDGKQIIRAGLEDHFCGKLLGLPHGLRRLLHQPRRSRLSDDMDTLMTLLATAGLNFLMGVPGADDIMLNYQSTSFHDALYLRELLGLKRAPEFEAWLHAMHITERRRPRAAHRRRPPACCRMPQLAELRMSRPGSPPTPGPRCAPTPRRAWRSGAAA